MQKIILTNQHIDNRGDESAVIGVISSLRKQYGQTSNFTILLQTKGHQFLPDEIGAIEKSMITDLPGIVIMATWILFKSLRLDVRKLLGGRFQEFLKTHEEADLIISSCGGPYIGDLYVNHELLHAMHLFVPQLLKKNTAFYAPSMGPFHKKWINPIRRKLFNNVNVIVLRDKVSFNYVKEFLPNKPEVFLTTDSCFSDLISNNNNERKNVVGVTPLDHTYLGSREPLESKKKYEEALIKTLNGIMSQDKSVYVEFFPQLFGGHTDVPFIIKIVSFLDYPERTIIFSDTKTGREQQKEIGRIKYMIATRYHSAIFSAKMGTPVVCIYYEHKARAFMHSIGLEEYCLDIYQITHNNLTEKIDLLLENYGMLIETLPERTSHLAALADKTAEIIKTHTTPISSDNPV